MKLLKGDLGYDDEVLDKIPKTWIMEKKKSDKSDLKKTQKSN